MDNKTIAFLAILAGLDALPNLQYIFQSSFQQFLNVTAIFAYLIPVYLIVIGTLMLFDKVRNTKFAIWPLIALLAYKIIDKYLLKSGYGSTGYGGRGRY